MNSRCSNNVDVAYVCSNCYIAHRSKTDVCFRRSRTRALFSRVASSRTTHHRARASCRATTV
jgi:hypothetical protein